MLCGSGANGSAGASGSGQSLPPSSTKAVNQKSPRPVATSCCRQHTRRAVAAAHEVLQLLVQPAACFAFLDSASRQPHEVQREAARAVSAAARETGSLVHNGQGQWLKHTVLVARLAAAEAQVTT